MIDDDFALLLLVLLSFPKNHQINHHFDAVGCSRFSEREGAGVGALCGVVVFFFGGGVALLRRRKQEDGAQEEEQAEDEQEDDGEEGQKRRQAGKGRSRVEEEEDEQRKEMGTMRTQGGCGNEASSVARRGARGAVCCALTAAGDVASLLPTTACFSLAPLSEATPPPKKNTTGDTQQQLPHLLSLSLSLSLRSKQKCFSFFVLCFVFL